MVPSPDRDLMEEGKMRGIVSKVGVIWGVWSEAEGWPTGYGSVELEVEVMKDGPWDWVMANGVRSVELKDVKYGRGNGQGCLGLRGYFQGERRYMRLSLGLRDVCFEERDLGGDRGHRGVYIHWCQSPGVG